jgi:hypothetical protein
MKMFPGILVLIVVLVGCGQQSQNLPTLAATAVPVTETSPAMPTSSQIPQGRPTLPPTWTPSPEANQAVEQPSDTPATVIQVVEALEACNSFDADREKSTSTITPEESPVAAWTPVQGASRYRVRLINEFGEELLLTNQFGEKLPYMYTTEPSYSFDIDLFEPGKRYGWGVYPEDSLGQQMCIEVGAEFYPALQ